MRNKLGIILLTVVTTALCLFYLSFTYISHGVDEAADTYALNENNDVDFSRRNNYIDSLWTQPVYNFLGAEFSLKEVKENELNLGLDLQGGMHVTLEISPVEILIALSGESKDENFRAALTDATQAQRASQTDFTTLFFEALYKRLPQIALTSIFANSANKGRIDFGASNDEVERVVRKEVAGAIDRAFDIIRTRIDKFGVTQPNIQHIQGTGRIQIELPGVDNVARVRKLLQGVAQLEFLEVWQTEELVPYLGKANDVWVKREKANGPSEDSTTTIGNLIAESGASVQDTTINDNLIVGDSTDSSARDSTDVPDLASEISPVFKYLRDRNILLYEAKDTSKINDFFNDVAIRDLLPIDLAFLWANKPDFEDQGITYYQLYAVKKGRREHLTGDVVVSALQTLDQYGRPAVSMAMNVEGSKKWKKMTQQNLGRKIAIALDNLIYTAPTVQSEITNGRSEITGQFTVEEAQDLANVLQAGKLPAPTRIVEEVVVGPSLGLQAQTQGLISIIAGLALVIVFMIAYYAKGGLIANAALLINIFFIFGILAQLNAALTLPGIAGIVLTIGMSIDANVLIFERIREELRKDNKNLLKAIQLGYEKAFWTIFDSNLTTLLTGIFLYSFGSGPIKGFAVTLMIGIICSFFSAVYITRVIVTYMTKKGNESKISFVTPFSKALLSNLNIDFLSRRKLAYIGSSLVIILGITLMAINGLNLGVDFKGGRSYIVSFPIELIPSPLETSMKADLDGADVEVKTYGNDRTMKITTSYLVEEEATEADEQVMATIISSIESFTGLKFAQKQHVTDGEFIIVSTSKVGATIADDIADASRSAGIFSLVAIFLYILIRFRKWQFGLGAIVALFHDTLMVLSIFAIASVLGISFEIDQVFVAAILTIIGYSINDTVVVFDRVRENMRDRTNASLALQQTLNKAINGTLNRTLITSVTTLLVVLVLFLFGGEVLRGFSFALLVGIIFGTYSSIFIATPIYHDTSVNKPAKKAA